MGYDRFNAGTWSSYARTTAGKTHVDYRRASIKAELDPRNFKIRESRASALNPNPTPIIIGLDVTGSMGRVVEAMRKGLGTVFEEIIERRPVTDPHVLAMAIGDFDCDRAPTQATQFESDPVVIGKQIEDLYLERGGGGNAFEGYLGPLYFAGMRTDCDGIRAGRKGFLLTVGDEEPQRVLRAASVEEFFGDKIERDLTAEELLALVARGWHHFHLMVEEGSHYTAWPDRVRRAWTDLIGQHALPLADHTKLAEVVISAIEVAAGRTKADVVKSWSSKSTSLVVAKAIGNLPAPLGVAAKGPRAL
jgi:hypothetical protein